MSEISCDICMDLLPLVRDGIASEDSKKAVEEHLQTCESCRSLADGCLSDMPAPDTEHALLKFRKQLRGFCGLLLLFGIFLGLSLTAGPGMFYNTLLMPLLGAIGYFLFRLKSLYLLPILLLAGHCLTDLLTLLRGKETLGFSGLLVWTFLYSLFAYGGMLIAALLHFAFRKEDTSS